MSYNNVPAQMREFPHWINWRYGERGPNGKLTKLPITPGVNQFASVIVPTSWRDFETALQHVDAQTGMGFVLQKATCPFYCVDLDTTDVAEHINIQHTICEILSETYQERSPNGGLHIWGIGGIHSGRRAKSVEIYDDRRFITVTGDVHRANPLINTQYKISKVWAMLGGGKQAAPSCINMLDTETPKHDDQEVLNLCYKMFGEKFNELWYGRFDKYYPSNSEADFALIDMLGYIARCSAQIRRLFLASPIAQREKTQKRVDDYVNPMIVLSFDNMGPEIDWTGLKELAADISQKAFVDHSTSGVTPGPGAPPQQAPPQPEPAAAGPVPPPTAPPGSTEHLNGQSFCSGAEPDAEFPISLPPGLMGELTSLFYASSYRPIREGALLGAIALLSGVCGRAYMTPSGAGLNNYMILIGGTGVGKELVSKAITWVRAHLEHSDITSPDRIALPAFSKFFAGSQAMSGQAVVKLLNEQPSCVQITGEFGLMLARLTSDSKNPNDAMLYQVLLDIYGKSGNNRLGEMLYSDKAKNTKAIIAPAFSLFGEGTPETFYGNIDDDIVMHGLVPRFLVLEYKGDRQYANKQAGDVRMPYDVLRRLADLTAFAMERNHKGDFMRVTFTPEADKACDDFDRTTTDFINQFRNKRTAIGELWNRAHLKAMKIACLVAVGVNPAYPVVDIATWNWAEQLIRYEVGGMQVRFEQNSVGENRGNILNDNRATDSVINIMHRWSRAKTVYELPALYHRYANLHSDGLIPYAWIQRNLANVKVFAQDKRGASIAIKAALRTLLENGIILQVDRKELIDRYGDFRKDFVVYRWAIER